VVHGRDARWSNDGTAIVYTRMGETYADDTVWIMNRNGSNPHRILRGGADPAWRP
jgi:Tol biopolymer transport system component